MRFVIAGLLVFTLTSAVSAPEACAQASCRQKCMDEENACLKRTGNKSQCGNRAQECARKCK